MADGDTLEVHQEQIGGCWITGLRFCKADTRNMVMMQSLNICVKRWEARMKICSKQLLRCGSRNLEAEALSRVHWRFRYNIAGIMAIVADYPSWRSDFHWVVCRRYHQVCMQWRQSTSYHAPML